MDTTQSEPFPCRLAVCRESLGDGNVWSIYVINEYPHPIDLVVEGAGWEWADTGHVRKPGTEFSLPGGGLERILRVNSDDAEMSMSVYLRITSGTPARLTFELGKLYRYRDPVRIPGLGVPGWLRTADP